MNFLPAFATPIAVSARPHLTANTCQTAPSTSYVTPKMAFSSIDRILTPDPTALPGNPTDIARAVYVQVLGNAHIMDSESEEFAVAESTFKLTGDIREFVRAVASSSTYRARFFDSVSQYRFIELAFKHLLARAPESRQEYAAAMAVYNTKGYDALISWFVDSEEYDENFGTQIVPYGIYMGCYSSNELFNRSVAMRLAPGSSDKGRPAMLQYCVLSGDSPSWLSISKALPPGTEKGTGFTIGGHWQSTQRNKNAPARASQKIPGGVLVSEY